MRDSDQNLPETIKNEPLSAPPPDDEFSCDKTISLNADMTLPLDQSSGNSSSYTPNNVPLEPGQTLGGYSLLRLLGEGGFAEVWEVNRLSDGRKLALKLLHLNHQFAPDAIGRFEQEGRLAASISHPRIVGVVGAEIIQNSPTIMMEVMFGGTLMDRLKSDGPMEYPQAVDAILDVFEGLEAAQDLGIIHRDIKPSNCFIDSDNRVKIGDFGLSKTLEPSVDLTIDGAILGTPAYGSPEQIRGLKVDSRSDQYSAGATLYALMTGKPPFEGVSAGDLIAKITSDTPFTPLEDHGVKIPKGLYKIIKRLLEKDPTKRYKDFSAVQKALIPYSSKGFLPARLDARLGAKIIDFLVLGIVMTPLMLGQSLEQIRSSNLNYWENGVALVAYIILEKLWNRTPGKFLLRLRVTSIDGSGISWKQSFIRNGVYALSGLLGMIFAKFVPGQTFWQTVLVYGIFSILFLTMRKRNGFAGIHEVLSNTRTIRNRGLKGQVSVEAKHELSSLPVPEHLPSHLGPFKLKETIWQNSHGSLSLAVDENLDRKVWVHENRLTSPEETLPHSETRATRLAWFQSGNHQERVWNAFEAPSGVPLQVLMAQTIDWSSFALLMADLLVEIQISLDRKDMPPKLSLAQLWVDGFGRLKVLEFPTLETLPPTSLTQEFPATEWPKFVQHFVRFWAESKDPTGVTTSLESKPNLTVGQTEFCNGILATELGQSELEVTIARLQELREDFTQLSCKRRFTHLIASYGILIAFTLLMLLFVLDKGRDWLAGASFVHIAMVFWGITALPAILLTALFKTGPMMRAFSMEIRTKSGERVSRLRGLARAGITWLPALFNLVLPALYFLKNQREMVEIFSNDNNRVVRAISQGYATFLREALTTPVAWAIVATALISIIGFIWAIKHPARGLADRLAGTRIVSR